MCVCVCMYVCMYVCACARTRVCVLAVLNKALVQRISNREFTHSTILQGTESTVATFHAARCVMSAVWVHAFMLG